MIFQLIAILLVFVNCETTAAATEATRDYCALPDAIYHDGVTAANFAISGWNYANAANWADYVVTCGGSHQSPIDIVTAGASTESIQPQIHYISKSSTQKYEEVNVTYTKEYEGEYSELTVADASNKVFKYFAKQFHIHTPSEHTIDGVYYDLEIHFVHQAVQDSEQDCNAIKNKLTVFGLMFKQSDSAKDFDVFKPWFDTNATGEVESFDLSDFISKMADQTYYHYNGSLTTLPCSQTVNWIVFSSPIPISTAQLTQFQNLYVDSTLFPKKNNNRPIQHLNDRKIYKGTAITSGVTALPDVSTSYTSFLMVAFMIIMTLI